MGAAVPGHLNPGAAASLYPIDRIAALALVLGLGYVFVPTSLKFTASNPDFYGQATVDKTVDYIYNLLVYMLILWVTWVRRHVIALGLSRLNRWFIAYAVWSTASLLWSPVPTETITNLVRLVFDMLLCAIVVLSPRRPLDSLDLLRVSLAGMILASLAFVVFIPAWGIVDAPSPHEGAWRGITDHKNAMAQIVIFASILVTYFWVTAPPERRRRNTLLLLATLVMTLGTTSSTGILLVLMIVPATYVLASPRFRPLVQSLGLWLGLAVGLVAIAYFYLVVAGAPTYVELATPIAEAFGKDVTLTGRTDIWSAVLNQARDYWLMGYGLGAYWIGELGPALVPQQAVGISLWQAHNGFVDVFNEGGAIGFVLLMAAIVSHTLWALRRWRTDSSMAIHLVFVGILLISNLSESSFTRPLEIGNMLFAFLMLCRVREMHLRPAQPASAPWQPTMRSGVQA